MVAYGYDSEGRYIGVVPMQADPRTPDNWLVPANATLVAPPDQGTYTAAEIPLFNEDTEQWELVKSPSKIAEEIELLKTENAEGVLLYETDANGDVVLRDATEVADETLVIQNQDALIAAKVLMDENIINKAMEVTGGSSVTSATAFLQAYQLRAANAAEYVTDGLLVGYAIDTYALGDALDTEAKIVDYYNKVMVYVDKYRNTEIATYLATKASLGF